MLPGRNQEQRGKSKETLDPSFTVLGHRVTDNVQSGRTSALVVLSTRHCRWVGEAQEGLDVQVGTGCSSTWDGFCMSRAVVGCHMHDVKSGLGKMCQSCTLRCFAAKGGGCQDLRCNAALDVCLLQDARQSKSQELDTKCFAAVGVEEIWTPPQRTYSRLWRSSKLSEGGLYVRKYLQASIYHSICRLEAKTQHARIAD